MKLENNINNPRREIFLNTLFVLFVFALFFTRAVIFFRYNLAMIDTDQPYMWLGATDYAKGLFHEPRYYGQEYNTYMEGLFAVPMLLLKVPVYFAVPLATHFISLFPFMFTACYLFFNNKKTHALLTLAVVLCLPAPYDLLNSLPRGFVTGLFFCSFFIINIVNPRNLIFVGINTLFGVIAYFVNPNSVLVSLPFLFYVFLTNYQIKKYYFVSVPGILFAIPVHLFFNQFYISKPGNIIHPFENSFSTYVFGENISNLDLRFGQISFFFQNNCLVLLFVLLLVGALLLRQNKKGFAAFVFFFFLLLFSFSASKILEGSQWVFMSYGRMFLGIPLLLCILLPLVSIKLPQAALPIFLAPLFFTSYKLTNLDTQLDWNYEKKYWGGVRLYPLKDAIGMIDFYKKTCKEHDVDFLLISSHFWMNTILSAAGPSIYEDFPETQETFFEKRYWVREKNKDRVIKKFMLLARASNLEKCMPFNKNFELQKIDDFGLYLIKNNKRAMGEIIILLRACEPKVIKH